MNMYSLSLSNAIWTYDNKYQFIVNIEMLPVFLECFKGGQWRDHNETAGIAVVQYDTTDQTKMCSESTLLLVKMAQKYLPVKQQALEFIAALGGWGGGRVHPGLLVSLSKG